MTPTEYPHAAGHRDVETSIEAARSIDIATGHLQRIALQAIRAAGARGLTTHELADAARIHRDALQPRVSELRARGLVHDSGSRRRNATGKNAIVWVASATGGAA